MTKALRLLGLVVIVACTPLSDASGTAPTSLAPEAPPSSSVPPARDAMVPDLRPDTPGLAEAGIDRYRFRSVLTIPTPSPVVSTYEARVEVEPAATHLASTGYTGDFEVYLGEERSLLRVEGGVWRPIDPDRPFRFSPAGPFPGYGAVGVIARMALGRGATVVGPETVGGIPATHLATGLDDGTTIDLWLSAEGVVVRAVVTQPADRGNVLVDWVLDDINGDFVVREPPVGG